jgi:hypothetical protein
VGNRGVAPQLSSTDRAVVLTFGAIGKAGRIYGGRHSGTSRCGGLFSLLAAEKQARTIFAREKTQV